MGDVIYLILVGIIGVGAGIAIGVMISGLRTEKPADSAREKSQPNMFETMKIMQDRKSGNLYPELNGKVVRYPAELSPSQRERLIAILESVLRWLRPPKVGSEDLAKVPAATSVPVNTNMDFPATQGAQQPKFSPIDMVARAVQSEVRSPTQPIRSIAAQIDEILQEQLVGSPLADRGIRLMELPSKGLVVMVGLDQYDEVGAVPDPEIQSMIRKAVAEWEERSTTE